MKNYMDMLDGATKEYESFNGNGVAPTVKQASPLTRSALQPAAQFTIRVRRISTNISGPLPICLFGFSKYASQYLRELSDQTVLPNSTTVYDGVTGGNSVPGLPSTANADRLVFQFTDGANTDTIEVLTDQNTYPELLSASAFTPMEISRIRMTLNDATQTGQYSLPIDINRNTTFGAKIEQPIVPSTQFSPMQFQTGVLDLLEFPMVIDSQTFMRMPILNVTGFEVAFSFTVKSFSRPLQA